MDFAETRMSEVYGLMKKDLSDVVMESDIRSDTTIIGGRLDIKLKLCGTPTKNAVL